MEDLTGSRNSIASPEACPLPQDPRAAKMCLGLSLSLPLLAAPPKGAATNSLRHSEAPESGPEAPGREISEARVSAHGGQNSAAPVGGWH